MALSCEEHLNICGSSIEDRGELRRRHLCDLTVVRVKLVDGTVVEVAIDLEVKNIPLWANR